MTLAVKDIDYIKTHLNEWLVEQSLGKPQVVYEIELRERMIRVEEELKHQRELMQQGFDAMAKRFEQVDKRFDMLTTRMDSFMRWSFATTLTVGGLVIGVLKLWPG